LNKLLIIIAILGAGYFSYVKMTPEKLHPTMGKHRPETASTNPIPKAVVIDGAKPYAITGCDMGEQMSGDSKKECLAYIEKWHDSCKDKIMGDMPDKVDSQDSYRMYIRRYFKCVNPKL
jgi:hypothetical protein